MFSRVHLAPLLWFRHISESEGRWEVEWLLAQDNLKVLQVNKILPIEARGPELAF